MRINVTGDCSTAKAIRGYLLKHDFHLTDHDPDWTVHIEETDAAAALDGLGGELEQAILRHLRKQVASVLEIHTGRTVSSEREIRILVPRTEQDRAAVAMGVFRGLLDIGKQAVPSRGWQTMFQRKTK